MYIYFILPNDLVWFFRYGNFREYVDRIERDLGGMDKFTRSYERFGIHKTADNGIKCHEWAPGADALYLEGEFSKA